VIGKDIDRYIVNRTCVIVSLVVGKGVCLYCEQNVCDSDSGCGKGKGCLYYLHCIIPPALQTLLLLLCLTVFSIHKLLKLLHSTVFLKVFFLFHNKSY